MRVDAGSTVRLLIHFREQPDPDRPFMYHCHLDDHEDDGMMWHFVLVN